MFVLSSDSPDRFGRAPRSINRNEHCSQNCQVNTSSAQNALTDIGVAVDRFNWQTSVLTS